MLPVTLMLILAVIPPQAERPLELPEDLALEGFYNCTGGQGPDAYRCVAVIVKRGDSYHLKWMFAGGETAMGIAQRDGNRLWVAWADDTILGLARYRIEMNSSKPRLVGEKGTDEVLTFLRGLHEERPSGSN
jgi:hypothetical protein